VTILLVSDEAEPVKKYTWYRSIAEEIW